MAVRTILYVTNWPPVAQYVETGICEHFSAQLKFDLDDNIDKTPVYSTYL